MNSKANFINNKTVIFINMKIDTSMPDTMHERKYEKGKISKLKCMKGLGSNLMYLFPLPL